MNHNHNNGIVIGSGNVITFEECRRTFEVRLRCGGSARPELLDGSASYRKLEDPVLYITLTALHENSYSEIMKGSIS